MMIYMAMSFVLLGIVAVLYYQDAKKDSVINIRTDMLGVLSDLRKNPNAKFKRFNVLIDDASKHEAPKFGQIGDHFELAACANPGYGGKVFVISAPMKIASDYTDRILKKILIVYGLLFIPFLLFGYILARIALVPVRNTYDALYAFNADIIHDLKTPITTISINAEMLNCSSSKPLGRIVSSVGTLEGLYLNLETYLREGTYGTQERIALDKLLHERLDVFRSLYPVAEFNETLETATIMADKTNIIRIVDNLLSNAVKYGGTKPIVSVRWKDGILSISDNGGGIQQTDKIFDRHYRESIYVKGYGLGLNIVKKLTERMGIAVTLETLPSGSTVLLQCSSLLVED